MPRDKDKNNGRPRGGRSAPPRRERERVGGEGRAGPRGDKAPRGDKFARDDRPARSSAPRTGERKFSDKKLGDKKFGDKRPYGARETSDKRYAAKPHAAKPYERKSEGFRKGPSSERGESRPRFSRDDRPQRDDRAPRKDFGSRSSEGRAPYKPRDASRPGRNSSAGRSGERKFEEKRDFKPRGEGARPDRGPRKDFGSRDRGATPRKEFNRGGDRGPRKESDRGGDKPWQNRAPARGNSRDERPQRAERTDSAPRKFDRPRFDKPREDRASRSDRGPSRHANRTDWQEHPRNENRDERPRRDNEDDTKIFAKRPAFGGRGEYRERAPDAYKRAPRAVPKEKKTGERIAKLVSRAGLCSRRDAEEWIVQGRVSVNGRVINSPALDVTSRDVVTVDGKPLPERERTRLFLYHKPRGLMTTHADPEGRATVFDNLPEGLPRLISIGRLDFNTEGLLLLTNDGGLARALELPDTGWLRRYRVRAHGEVTQVQLDALKKGVEVDGVKYGSIDAMLERDKSANVWIVFAIREGKNREVRNVMAHLGLEVNRLIRISYGPFQLAELAEGEVEEVKTRVLREQLGEKIAASAGAIFDRPMQENVGDREGANGKAPRDKSKPIKPLGKNGLIADRKGRRVLVQRSGGAEERARNEDAATNAGPPRRPQRGYKGKRDIKPRGNVESD